MASSQPGSLTRGPLRPLTPSLTRSPTHSLMQPTHGSELARGGAMPSFGAITDPPASRSKTTCLRYSDHFHQQPFTRWP
eukprot:6088835-Alexandrium_andersonii.AAC.1